jgi:hypothetical protein
MAGAPKAAPTGNALQWFNDYTTFGTFVNDLTPYRDLVAYAQPLIADAMGYSSLHADLREEIWDQIDAAETLGWVADSSTLTNYPTLPYSTPGPYTKDVDFTRAEAIESYAKKAAHCLYHEVNGTFPWSIQTLSATNLTYLLDPDELYTTFDTEGSPPANQIYLIDYSPYKVYENVKNEWGSGTTTSPEVAMTNVTENIFVDYVHSTASDPLWAITFNGSLVDHISRSGCPFAGRLVCAAARAINIPARVLTGWYAATTLHTSAGLPTIDKVFGHSDDIYGGGFDVRIGLDKCDSYADWEANIFTQSPYPPSNQTLSDDTRYRSRIKQATRIDSYWLDRFVWSTHGWAYIKAQGFEELLSAGELSTFYYDLAELTQHDGHATGP